MSFTPLKKLLFFALALFCLAELTHFGHAEEFFCGHEGGSAVNCCAAAARTAEPKVVLSAPDTPAVYPPARPAERIPALLPEDIFHPPAA